MITLDELIKQGESFTEQIKFVPAPSGVMRFYPVYSINNQHDYENWKATALRFIRVNYPNDKSITEFEGLSSDTIGPTNHAKMLALTKALNVIPQTNLSLTKLQKKDNGVTINVHQNQSQTQNQEQNIALNLFIESIKDELTGKQLKEIIEIIETHKDKPEEAKPKIIEKIKGFGESVLSNILANIITNPLIFTSF